MNSNPYNISVPAFLRMPKKGERCAYTGLSRSKLYKLTSGENPPVEPLHLIEPGAKRGTRLIPSEKLIEYIVRHGKPSGKLPDPPKKHASSEAQPSDAADKKKAVVEPEQFLLLLDYQERPDPAVATTGEGFSIVDFMSEVRALEEAGYPDVVAHSMVLGNWSRGLNQDQVEELLLAAV